VSLAPCSDVCSWFTGAHETITLEQAVITGEHVRKLIDHNSDGLLLPFARRRASWIAVAMAS